jgi:hypothetical protein
MSIMFAAQPWHFWLGLVLLVAGVGAVLQAVVGYVVKVTGSKHPPKHRQPPAQQ